MYRRHGISQQTLYRWKQKYDGLDGRELKRLKALEEENARLKPLIAEQALDNQALKELLRRDWWGPPNGGQPWRTRKSGLGSRSDTPVGWWTVPVPQTATAADNVMIRRCVPSCAS